MDQPGFARRGIVHNDMDIEVVRNIMLNLFEKLPKLPRPMARHALTSNSAYAARDALRSKNSAWLIVALTVSPL